MTDTGSSGPGSIFLSIEYVSDSDYILHEVYGVDFKSSSGIGLMHYLAVSDVESHMRASAVTVADDVSGLCLGKCYRASCR